MAVPAALPHSITPVMVASAVAAGSKHWWHETFHAPQRPLQRLIFFGLGLCILLAIADAVASTTDGYEDALGRQLLLGLRWLLVGIFISEYALRLWSIACEPRYRGVMGRLRYCASFFACIDLIAIVAMLPIVALEDLAVLRAVRTLRMLAVLRLGRYSQGLRLFGRVFVRKRGELVASLVIVLVLLLLAASLMYSLEHAAQPELFGSIPRATWWAIITLTTVGYGDAVPATQLGRLLGGFISLLGVGVAAMPAGIIVAGIQEDMRLQQEATQVAAEATPTEAEHVG